MPPINTTLGGRLSAETATGLDQEVRDIAWKAQWRLCTRYKKLADGGKNKLGFAWALAVKTEPQPQQQAA